MNIFIFVHSSKFQEIQEGQPSEVQKVLEKEIEKLGPLLPLSLKFDLKRNIVLPDSLRCHKIENMQIGVFLNLKHKG